MLPILTKYDIISEMKSKDLTKWYETIDFDKQHFTIESKIISLTITVPVNALIM